MNKRIWNIDVRDEIIAPGQEYYGVIYMLPDNKLFDSHNDFENYEGTLK